MWQKNMRMVGSLGYQQKKLKETQPTRVFIELVIEAIFSILNQVLSAYTSYEIIIFKK